MDQYGFFIYWKSEGREGDVKELSQVNDIRGGELPKVCKDKIPGAEMIFVWQDPRLQTTLKQRHGENFHERSLIVCSGLDMVNITCTNIIFKDVATAQVRVVRLSNQPNIFFSKAWKLGLRLLTNNNKINNVCPMENLKKHWMRLK